VEALFEAVWKTRLHSPDKSLLLLFVDQFAEIKYYLKSNAINSVSGNFWEIPAILLRSNDKGASHIVTHELIHGPGKPITKDSIVSLRCWQRRKHMEPRRLQGRYGQCKAPRRCGRRLQQPD
jgi:hypothetical protein